MKKMKPWLMTGAVIFMLGLVGLSQAQIVHQETQTGGSTKLSSVTTSANLAAVSGQLYLAAISTRPRVVVTGVSGLGLSWTLVKAQCSGGNATGVEVWMAQGTPSGDGTVTATLVKVDSNAVIAVSRYSGVHATAPIGSIISGNTNGSAGACSGGIDNAAYSFNLTTTAANAQVYGAASMRTKQHTPGAGYMERTEFKQGTAGGTASVAVEDKNVASISTVAVDGTLSAVVDWAVVGVEIKPSSGGGPVQRTLTVSTVGSGSVALNPAGGTYNDGTVVTLTATPAAGFQFSGWSGDLTGSTNPATITMNANKNVTATFTAVSPSQFTLTVNTVGSGSVSLNPPGGVYNSGTVVTLMATPAAGFQFSGWSGALTGSTNPTTITMNANKSVTATFTGGSSSGTIVHEETQTGGSTKLSSVSTSANLTGLQAQLYLAAISSRPRLNVTGVSGLGLSWTLVKAQCSGGNATGVEVWMAQGTPSGNGAVTATFGRVDSNAVIAVSRYSGVHATAPIGNIISGNTNGSGGACTGGVANSSYSFNLTTTVANALVYGAAGMRTKTHTPGAGYTERAEFKQGTLGNTASIAVEDKNVAAASTVTVDGTFNAIVDWAVVGVEIKPGSGSPTQRTLTVSTVGSGSVGLNPAGGTYNDGTVVTLTATPAAGFQFSGWSGALTGSTNPATLTMNANKSVTATFTAVSPTQFTLTASTVGSGSVALNPPGGVYNSGTVVTLTATPAAGFQFSGWSGALTGSTNPATITMNANKSVTATFTAVSPTQFTLTANTVGSGSVALNPPGGVYNSGTIVTLTATPAAGFQFSGWSGALTGSTNPATLTMDANKSVTATFTAVSPTQFTLTANTVGSGSVSLNPAGGVYNNGTVVTLTATPAAGFQFSGWSGDLTGSINPATLTMDANKSVIATFAASGTDPNTNIAKSKSLTASSTYSGKPPENAVDGSTSTYWRNDGTVSSSNPIAWLRVDLGAVLPVGRAIVRWKETYFAKSYELQVSNDDINWTTVYSTTTGASGSQQFVFPQTTARYVRFYMTKNSKSNYQIYELEVYSGAASTPKLGSEAEAEAAIPGDFVLEQNYPNPFNPGTKISFGLPQASRVTIKVYTINGMEVKTLIDAQYSAGMHSVVFQPRNLPSGVYFYVMQAGEVRKVRQLMLLK